MPEQPSFADSFVSALLAAIKSNKLFTASQKSNEDQKTIPQDRVDSAGFAEPHITQNR